MMNWVYFAWLEPTFYRSKIKKRPEAYWYRVIRPRPLTRNRKQMEERFISNSTFEFVLSIIQIFWIFKKKIVRQNQYMGHFIKNLENAKLYKKCKLKPSSLQANRNDQYLWSNTSKDGILIMLNKNILKTFW